MLSNLHTHTCFCDGKNTPEEVVLYAIDKGFDSIGFSGHGYTPFHLGYCMKDTDGYIAAVQALKEKYKNKIQIYLGVEEDGFAPCDRGRFDYIIGSMHYVHTSDEYLPVDSSRDCMQRLRDHYNSDGEKIATEYYSAFCDYILKRKPDIIGHFDLLTKFDEKKEPIFLGSEKYHEIAEYYVKKALTADCFFEVNTGAMARGMRTAPYPHERLLHIILKNGGKLVLSSDSHEIKTLDFEFENTRLLLKDIGFNCVYALFDGEFQKDLL